MEKKTNLKNKVIGMITYYLCVVTILGSIGCSETTKKPTYSKQDAVAWSHVCVNKYLKSPGSAQYPYQADETIDQLNDSTFQVLSYVDSQNEFGAILRTYYKCKVIFNPDETATCIDMKLEPAK